MRRKLVVLGLVAGLVAALGLAGTAAAADPPNIKLFGVSAGKKQFTITVEITNFKMYPKLVGKKNKAGGGHWHMYIQEVANSGVQCNLPQESGGPDPAAWKYAGFSAKKTGKTALKDVEIVPEQGKFYCLKVGLAKNNHAPVKVGGVAEEDVAPFAQRLSAS